MITAVDPNKKDLKLLVKYLRIVFPKCEVVMFSDPEAAAAYTHDNPIDVFYTEVAMLEMDGFSLQAAALTVQPAVLTIFVTGTELYAKKALDARAQAYIIKLVTQEAVWEAMNETKYIKSGEKY